MFDSVCSGVPLITKAWSGESDYIYKDGKIMAEAVDYKIEKISEQMYQSLPFMFDREAKWAYPVKESYVKKLRYVYENYDECKNNAVELANYINEEFSFENIKNKYIEAFKKYL